MKEDNKTKKQLVHELTELRSQNAALNKSITGSISDQLAVEELQRYTESIVETIRQPLLVLDADLKIISANRNFYSTFKVIHGETLGCFIYDLGNKQWNIPGLRKLLEEVLPEKQAFDDFEVAHNFQDIGHKIMLLNAREIYRKDIGAKMILLAIEDITERKRAEEALRVSREQLHALAAHLQQIREEERLMIAREIHDEMGGGLTGLKIELSRLLRKGGDADHGEKRVALMDRIQTSNALIDQMIHIVRRISMDLRPSVLDDLGLIAALEWQLSEFTSRTEISHEFATTFKDVNMEKGTAIAVFRILQEALTNVVRHSRATKVAVVLREGERSLFGDESLVLEIRDNGRGITEEEILNTESLGLLGMKERVLPFKGELSISGEPGGGTALVLKIPRKQGEPS